MKKAEMRELAAMVAEILGGGVETPREEKTVQENKATSTQKKAWNANMRKTKAMAKKLEDAGYDVNRDAKTTWKVYDKDGVKVAVLKPYSARVEKCVVKAYKNGKTKTTYPTTTLKALLKE